MQKRVVFDFDGVIHSYTSGWKGEEVIPDPPVKGIDKAIQEIYEAGYQIVVCSTRCCDTLGRQAVIKYLKKHDLWKYVELVTDKKVPAVAYIDDRAIRFDGHPDTLLMAVNSIKPWNH